MDFPHGLRSPGNFKTGKMSIALKKDEFQRFINIIESLYKEENEIHEENDDEIIEETNENDDEINNDEDFDDGNDFEIPEIDLDFDIPDVELDEKKED